ncbi:hypothetical protein N7492_006604 [Penicillium capsulatum]|uniref:AB hydrolase-1 domain-containing protein n=1 Tax=Penicillium capsulatum TaxID=69766 RepID=A0A9W9HY98_9EURO|nr:hypothetical protein N7492_006604 [Penicillium capsulatum]KAJ6116439.1 hypothetical protein N7512_006164 [Penicillium capsulatum]
MGSPSTSDQRPVARSPCLARAITWIGAVLGLVGLMKLHNLFSDTRISHVDLPWRKLWQRSPYGQFPLGNDPFQFIPCTNASLPPPLEDPEPRRSWAARFDPNPDHWSWSRPRSDRNVTNDPYAGRGIFMCGYLDVPLDYLNSSDTRIVRLAVTKLQVSGLTRLDAPSCQLNTGHKSKRTLIIEPGGPGGSGTFYTWTAAEDVTERLSDGQFDVLGWDPRGVNISLPSASCFPNNAFRDRWSLLTQQYREVADPTHLLGIFDAMHNATMHGCWQMLGDFGRFISTASVARDVDEIRKALGEEDVTGYFVSYGTGIGQTYANMFPDKVGRLILDGTEYVKDHRQLGGFGQTALDNTTDAWRAFLGECIDAGPDLCALAKPINNSIRPVTLASLESRMESVLNSLIAQPASAYSVSSGPSLITYSSLVDRLYDAMYDPRKWPNTAQMLSDLEANNATLAAILLDKSWSYDPTFPLSRGPASGELGSLVICADSYDAPQPESGLQWWGELWKTMTAQSWIAGNSRFFSVLPCRHYTTYWPSPAEVYRGDLNHTLKTPVLLVAETYDPATPLRNGRKLLEEMGQNARLIVHHAYGHSSNRDRSDCTDQAAKAYILDGILPSEKEIQCYANKKPYRP